MTSVKSNRTDETIDVPEIFTANEYQPSKATSIACAEIRPESNSHTNSFPRSTEEWDCNLLMDCTHHGVMSKSVNILTVTTKEFKNMETQVSFSY